MTRLQRLGLVLIGPLTLAACAQERPLSPVELPPPSFLPWSLCPIDNRPNIGTIVLPEAANLQVFVSRAWNQDEEPSTPVLFQTSPEDRLLLGPGSMEYAWVIVGPYEAGTVVDFRPQAASLEPPHTIVHDAIHCSTFLNDLGEGAYAWDVYYNLWRMNDFILNVRPIATFVSVQSVSRSFTMPASGPGGESRLELEVGVFPLGLIGALPSRTITLSVAREDGQPAGTLSQTVVHTGPSGVARVTYTAPAVGGQIVVTGTSPVASPRSRTITVQQQTAELTLSCTPAAVVRGTTVTCTAGTEPPGAPLRVTEWMFEPAAAAGLPPVTLQEDVKVWAGPLAIDGTVTVSAVLDQQTKTASQALSVQRRDWSGKTVSLTVKAQPAGNLPDPPTKDEELGSATPSHAFTLPQLIITEGPNRDYWFFTDLPVSVTMDVRINTNALQQGSVFWRIHPPMQAGHVIGRRMCLRSELLSIVLPLVRKHEGFSRSDAGSHVQTYADEFEREARKVFEPVVRHATDTRAFGDEISAIHAKADAYTERITDHSSANPFRPPCDLNLTGREQR